MHSRTRQPWCQESLIFQCKREKKTMWQLRWCLWHKGGNSGDRCLRFGNCGVVFNCQNKSLAKTVFCLSPRGDVATLLCQLSVISHHVSRLFQFAFSTTLFSWQRHLHIQVHQTLWQKAVIKLVCSQFYRVDRLQTHGPQETEERRTSGAPWQRRCPAAHMTYAASPKHSGPNWVQISTEPSGLPTLISSEERRAGPLIIHQMRRGHHPRTGNTHWCMSTVVSIIILL